MKSLPREYTLLFNAITDVDRALLRLHRMLAEAQQAAENLVTEPEPETDE